MTVTATFSFDAMPSVNEVESFLNDFKYKMSIWDVLFRSDRPKNQRTMLELEITYNYAKQILGNLEVADYSSGPEKDVVYMEQPVWIFGRPVKNREVYIKISTGPPQSRVLCVSFHIAEYPMSYPFKT